MTSSEIRAKFLEFFESKNHTIVPSAPIVQKNDPSLMFTNSGMVQFKDYFLGHEQPIARRIADSQKCLRVSGKHNDLDDVGKDTYHHTMFEMLGNWSFNDYFKEEAIAWSWEFLTEVLGIDKDIIYVTIFEGDEKELLKRDQEAYAIWQKHIDSSKILEGNKKDNFWEMGSQGPCGPCSEIHIDLRTDEEKKILPGEKLVNQDHPLVIEVWNLVFMQYLRKADGSIEELGSQNIDTGMGFERLCMVMQGKTSNYDTDLFTPLIKEVERISSFTYPSEESINIAIRVVVDHIRTLAFSIADGQIPSNIGAGYVIRRILRRAVGYAYRFLNQKDPFLYRLIPTLVDKMGEAYPELKEQQKFIENVLKEEEGSFLHTIQNGLERLDFIMAEKKKHKIIDGKLIYELKDTYGFPPDFSRIIAEENGFTIDEEGFLKEEKRLKDLSRKAAESATSDWEVLIPDASEHFLGHQELKASVYISKYRKTESKKGEFYQLVFTETPFYAEGGGQIGDTGFVANVDEKIAILGTQKELGVIYSIVKELPKNLHSEFLAQVDEERRLKITQNHSATHLLHEALRETLGNHVEQKGSLVSDQELRFDFSHFSKVGTEELATIEAKVNQKIQKKIPLQEYNDISIDEALERGAMALFGEKYGEKVRMIQFDTSKELCGGSHVSNTGELVHFKILSESSVAAGVRRVHAVSGTQTLAYLQSFEEKINQISVLLNHPQNLVEAIEKQQAEIQQLKAERESWMKQQASQEKGEWLAQMEQVGAYKLLVYRSQLDSSSIKDLVFQIKKENPNLVLVIGTIQNDKPMLTVGISEDIQSLDASKMIRELAKEIQGGGGGQSHFATAGGKNPEGLDVALSKAKSLLT